MRVIVIHKNTFYRCPPAISTTLILSDLGYDVTLVTEETNKYWDDELKKRNIDVLVIPNKYKKYGSLGKILSYLNFSSRTFSKIEEVRKKDKDVHLWVKGAHTILALGSKINNYPHILQIVELHETSKMQLRAISKVINKAKLVFMPEYNRSILYQIWFNLKRRPIVLPNKPYFYPSDEIIRSIEEKYKDMVSIFEKFKVILYQGQIASTRDLTNYIKAVKELGGNYRIVLMGNDHNMVHKYREIDENIIHIDFIPAPDYLLLTSKAYIGILTYNPESLNNMYCAPNKIYEYSKYSLPMLGNNIPGLKYAIEPYNAGVIVDEDNVQSIKNAILEIDSNYDKYKENSAHIFIEQDNEKIIRDAMNSIK